MTHELAEKLAGLASRVNNLATYNTGDDSRQFMELQDNLSKLALVAIAKELNEEDKAYKAAVDSLNSAIGFIGEADKKTSKVAETIKLIADAIKLVTKVIPGVIC